MGKVYMESPLGPLFSDPFRAEPAASGSSGVDKPHLPSFGATSPGPRQLFSKNRNYKKIIAATKAICLMYTILMKPHHNLVKWRFLSPLER